MHRHRCAGRSPSSLDIRRFANSPAHGFLEDARRIPAPFGTNQQIGIVVEGETLGMLLGLEFDLDIVKVGEHEFAAWRALESALLPETKKPGLRMRVQDAVAFLPAQFDSRVHDPAGEARVAAFVADGQSLELGEIRKITDPHTADR